jgi:hypothetical protein
MRRQLIALLLAGGCVAGGCQVNNGVLCSYLNDKCGEDAGEDETGDPEPLGDSCDQIGSALGLDLVPVTYCVECEPAWWEMDALYNLDWSQLIPRGWEWDATPPLYGKPARLRGIQGELGIWWGGDKVDAVVTWTQTDGIESGHRGLVPVQIIEQTDGSQIVWLPAGPDGWMTLFSGSAAVLPSIRGWSSRPEEIVVELAGPSGTNAAPTSHGQKGFEAVRGQCKLAQPSMCDMPGMCEDDTSADDAAGGSGDGGGTTGEPEENPAVALGEDPCIAIAASRGQVLAERTDLLSFSAADHEQVYVLEPVDRPIVEHGAGGGMFGGGWLIPEAEGPTWIENPGTMVVVTDDSSPFDFDLVTWIAVPSSQVDGWSLAWKEKWTPPHGSGPALGEQNRSVPFDLFVEVEDAPDLAIMATGTHAPHVTTPFGIGLSRWGFNVVSAVDDPGRRLAGVVRNQADWYVVDGETVIDEALEWSWSPLGATCVLAASGSSGAGNGGSSSTGEAVDESGG